MAAQRLTAMPPGGHQVSQAAEGTGHRLGLMVVVHGGEIAPGGVSAHLDHPGAEFDADDEPAQQQDHQQARRDLVGAEEADEEPGLEQQRFPAEAVEALPDRRDREVQGPHRQEHRDRHPGRSCLGQTDDRRGGQDHSDHGHQAQAGVRIREALPPEERRRLRGGGQGDEARGRGQTALAEEGRELGERGGEGDEIEHPEAPLDHLTRDRVVLGREQGQHRSDVHGDHLQVRFFTS